MWMRLAGLAACAAVLLSAESGVYHLFQFGAYKGTLTYDSDAPERSRVDLSIESASAVCRDTWVSEKDLKKIQVFALEDMLAAVKYPELHFSSTRVASKSATTFEISGMLTIRGIAKPATIDVALAPGPGGIASLSGRAAVKLRDYGLKPPTAALGTIGTKNELTVEFTLLPVATAARPANGG